MNLLLSVGSWFAQNWMLIALIVIFVALMVPTYLRQKKEANARNEIYNSIKKGVKVVTHTGIYGTVESVEETTDGKVVTIVTGKSKNPCTITMHINAIMGIDNKTPTDSTSVVDEDSICAQETICEHESSNDVEAQVYGKKSTKSRTSSSSKSSK